MNCSAAILTQWRREDPDRLLQAALSQAERLAETAPQVEALRAQNAWLHQQVEVKTKRIAELQAALEAAQRAAHRQAAPFRIEAQKRAAAPKRPGRKHGHPGAFRHKPEQTDEHIEVQLCSCPHCGGAQFKDQHAIEQLIEDIPPVRPHVTRLTIYQGTCVGCGQSVRANILCRCHWPSARPVCTSAHEPLLWLPISTRPKGFPCAKPVPFCAIVSACSSAPAAFLRPWIGSLPK